VGFWGTVGATALAGAAVAIVAVFLAWLVTDRYAAARERVQARRERDLAAAADFYQLLGNFFAAWKTWEFHSRDRTHPVSDQRHSELVSEAAAAEGAYEAFVVRVVLEHDLSYDQKAALWCLRFALKQLRFAMRQGEPLRWWRSGSGPGHREYQAYKELVSIVAEILTEPSQENAQSRKVDRAAALKEVTGNGGGFTDTPRFTKLFAEERQKPIGEWVLLAEQLRRPALTTSDGKLVERVLKVQQLHRPRVTQDDQ
jgi:hypothetical protein